MAVSLWYRHWLEMRGGLLVAVVGVALLSAAYPFFASGSDGRVPHVWLSSAASWALGFFNWGNGVRSITLFYPNHPSIQFTLGLSVSRISLVLTRLAVAYAAVVAQFAIMFVSNTLALLLMGRAPAFGAMAGSSALAALLVAAIVTILAMVGLVDENHFNWVLPVAFFAAFSWAWPPTTAFIGSQEVPWTGVATLVLVIGAALSAIAVLAYKRDF